MITKIVYKLCLILAFLLLGPLDTYAGGAGCAGDKSTTGNPPVTLYQYLCGQNTLQEYNGFATDLVEECRGMGSPALSGFNATHDFGGSCGVQNIYHFDENCGLKFDDGGNSEHLG
ncbi:MAG: hypothetical protein JKX73_09070, partial [Flavobacteriales bacterium]|nr:hypothetical protein [Flavobacteriales bacterium]